jgi:hypothetical protein
MSLACYAAITAMSPERDQNPITLEEIISNAKEIMLRDGKHLPVLIVEADSRLVAGQISYMPATHGERVELMHHLGQATAKSGRVDHLQQVFMVTEGWMSVASQDKQAEIRPSQDPNRKEVLIVSAMQFKERKKQMEVFEVLRDSEEQVIGFEEFLPDREKKDESVDIPLVEAFVQGFQTAFRTKFN